jgi:hypothetical protein
VALEGEVWLFFKVGRWGLKNIPRHYSFGDVGWGVWRKWMCMFCFNFFFLLSYGDLMNIYSRKYFI